MGNGIMLVKLSLFRSVHTSEGTLYDCACRELGWPPGFCSGGSGVQEAFTFQLGMGIVISHEGCKGLGMQRTWNAKVFSCTWDMLLLWWFPRKSSTVLTVELGGSWRKTGRKAAEIAPQALPIFKVALAPANLLRTPRFAPKYSKNALRRY